MRKPFILSCLLFMVVICALTLKVGNASRPLVIYIDPIENTASEGAYFTVKINIIGAIDLYSYELRLGWYGPALNVTSITEGDFPGGGIYETHFVSTFWNGPDPVGMNDYIYIYNSLRGVTTGADGSGTLAQVTFLVEETGESGLQLYGVQLRNSFGFPITNYAIEDGYVNVAPPKFHVTHYGVSSIMDPTLIPGETFSINVSLSNVIDLYGFGFRLGYDNLVLNATDVSVTSFLAEPTVDKGIDNELGFVWVYVNSSTPQSVSDEQTVADVNFQVLGVGECFLDVYNTTADDRISRLRSPPLENSPPADDGYFSNVPIGHDISVTRVTALPSEVTQGEAVSINVTVMNVGAYNETFDVTVYYDSEAIDTRTNVMLESWNEETLLFSWDTSGVAGGEYKIKAEATVVEGETKTANNVRISYSLTKVEVPASDFLLYVGVGIAVVVIVVALVYFLKIRKPKTV